MIALWAFLLLCNTAYASVNKSEIFLYYYNQTGGPNQILSNTSLEQDICTWFNHSKKTVFHVHGWYNTSNAAAGINESYYVRVAILASYDVNLFTLDYPANDLYNEAVEHQPIIGQHFGEYLNYLKDNCSLDLAEVVIIGHSLGAHISGVAGKTTNSSVGVIFGLDPAGPLFFVDNKTRLVANDAVYVQVIHTNAGEYGYAGQCGDSDFWVNGGHLQPSCTNPLDIFCSHRLSYLYFAKSVTSPKLYKSTECVLFLISTGFCMVSTYDTAYMGGLYPDKSALGDYVLNATAPY